MHSQQHSHGTAQDDDDDYIQAHMARLLEQSGARTTASASQRQTANDSRGGASAARPEAPARKAEAPAPTAPAAEVKLLTDPSQMSPRIVAPELAANLSAMRELANMNACTNGD